MLSLDKLPHAFGMFSFSSSVYDDEALLDEMKLYFGLAINNGLIPPESQFPSSIPEYVSIFQSICLPYQTFSRFPHLSFSFIPDIDALAEDISEDLVYTVRTPADLPRHAKGFVLSILPDSLTLFHVEDNHATKVWEANPFFAKAILDQVERAGE
jgi:hypothetical protein